MCHLNQQLPTTASSRHRLTLIATTFNTNPLPLVASVLDSEVLDLFILGLGLVLRLLLPLVYDLRRFGRMLRTMVAAIRVVVYGAVCTMMLWALVGSTP